MYAAEAFLSLSVAYIHICHCFNDYEVLLYRIKLQLTHILGKVFPEN